MGASCFTSWHVWVLHVGLFVYGFYICILIQSFSFLTYGGELKSGNLSFIKASGAGFNAVSLLTLTCTYLLSACNRVL